MNIQIHQLLEGAKKAKGITVIIDVFRAFTLEAYLYAQGAKKIYPIADLEVVNKLRQAHPEYIYCGERGGKQLAGYAFGNSPSSILGMDFTNQTIVHTTSAGTQGIFAAKEASEILTGSFVNAKAIAQYIKKKNPEEVSLVAMGWNGLEESEEDTLCATYLKSLLENHPMRDIQAQAEAMKHTAGKKFFDPKAIDFPEGDFACCVNVDAFDFVIRMEKENGLYYGKKIKVEDGQ
ncbi:MAG: 2-phosphosulfolactate phosphatase [Solobacterium sp.]|nr:2-phosphosulfolactate phosphatase [Solobacterium sp.]